jgi:hypothetical protein
MGRREAADEDVGTATDDQAPEPTMTIFDPQAMLVSRYVSLRKKSK